MASGIYAEQTDGGAEAPEASGNVESEGARCSRYADIAVELGYCARERVDEALRTYLESEEEGKEFGSYLVEKGVITREQSRACERGLRGHSTIGGFSILEKVGQGGMGTVFRARQISMDRIVAVKILAPKYGKDPSFKERFLQEARTCAKLSHLNIINGIDCGEDSGYAYFAMEFVDGRTVKQILKDKQRLEPDEAFKIIRQIADALSYARKLAMVHRDIKPDNIMLTPSGTAKLCDLGLAMQAESEQQNEAIAADATEQSEGGEGAENSGDDAAKENGAGKPKKKALALGTPHYMSPEQARGETNIDQRSDIYSLGATFYHLITGKTMFEGKSSTEIMTHQVLSEAPNPCVIDPKIPPGIGAIISKMSAKAAGDRYSDADALIADLDAAKNGVVPEAAMFAARSSCGLLPPTELRRLREGGGGWKRKIPHIAAAAVLGVIAYFVISSMGKQNPTDVASLPTTSVAASAAQATTETKTNTTETVPADTKVATTEVPKPPEIKKDPPTDVVKPPTPPVDPKITKPPDNGETKPPTLPNNDTKPLEVIPPAPPPVPELPRPELKLTTDILYARFLNELENRVGRMEAGKLYAEMLKLSLEPAYAVAREDIKAEMADLKGGWDYEVKALKRMGDQKDEIEFTPDLQRTWTFPKGKAIGYDENRGLQIELPNGAAFYLQPTKLSLETIQAKAPDTTPLGKTQFNYVRGNKAGVFALLPMLSAPDQKRWERKFNLSSIKELDLTAAEAYKNLTTIAEAKSWRTFSDMVVDYMRDYASTPTFRKNAAQIRQWQEAALASLAPPSKLRPIFHAASVREIPDKKGGEPHIELIYDFKTPEQALDFSCAHGKLRVENGQLIVPEGGGAFAHIRLVAPFTSIESFKAEGKSLQPEQKPMGVIFIEAAQAVTGPSQNNAMLKLNPDNKFAALEHMADARQTFEGPPPAFNWLKPTTISFKHQKGDDTWLVDDKQIGIAKVPKQFAGGWIALWGTDGHQAWTRVEITMKPDDFWVRMMTKGKTK